MEAPQSVKFAVHLYDEACMNMPAKKFSGLMSRATHIYPNNSQLNKTASAFIAEHVYVLEGFSNYEAAQRYANQADCAGYNIQVIHGGDIV